MIVLIFYQRECARANTARLPEYARDFDRNPIRFTSNLHLLQLWTYSSKRP